ncbi:GPI-anchored mannoprotein [Sarracenia purpurea var. burkii]
MANSFSKEVLEHVFSCVQPDKGRSAISLTYESWCETERSMELRGKRQDTDRGKEDTRSITAPPPPVAATKLLHLYRGLSAPPRAGPPTD